jgi:uncharacterized circularly permuted ATP-grasp superfamily protein
MIASAASQHCQNLPLSLIWQGDWRDRADDPSGTVYTLSNRQVVTHRLLKPGC